MKPGNFKNVISMMNQINAATAAEMVEQAGFDFLATKVPVYYNSSFNDTGSSAPIMVPDRMAIVKLEDYSYIATMGHDYELYQYAEMFDFTDVLVEKHGSSYLAGTTTGNGAKAFLLMKTEECFKLGQDDDIECYFYIATSHDGTIALDAVAVPYRKQGNMLLSLPKDIVGRGFKFKHTKNMNQRVGQAKSSLSKIKAYWDEAAKDLTIFASVKLTEKQFDEYMKMIIPEPDGDSKAAQTRAENAWAEMKTIYLTNPACSIPTCKGSLAGAYFAACIYHEHYVTPKGGKKDPEDARILSLLNGGVHKNKAKAYGMARKMADTLGGSLGV
jgi:phage/plasmid-like protein (TIGR03299 family)